MAVHKVNLKLYKGATFDSTWTWKTGPADGVKLPVDLTGCTARAQVRAKIGSTPVLLDMTTGNGMLVLGGALGTIRMLVPDETTAAATWVTGVYDLFIYFPSGTAVVRMAGGVSVTPGVTVAP